MQKFACLLTFVLSATLLATGAQAKTAPAQHATQTAHAGKHVKHTKSHTVAGKTGTKAPTKTAKAGKHGKKGAHTKGRHA